MSVRRIPRISLRTEATSLLAGLLALFALLASISYFGFRSTVKVWLEEEARTAARWAERLAESVAGRQGDQEVVLAQRAPPGTSVAIFNQDGTLLHSHGFDRPPEARVEGVTWPPQQLEVRGPTSSEPPTFVALLPIPHSDRVLRFEFPAGEVAGRQTALAQLTPWMVGVGLAAVLLLALYSRALLGRYERWLAGLRQALGSELPAASDEELLLASFERALGKLRAAEPGTGEVPIPARGDVRPEEVESGFLLLDREGHLLAANDRAHSLLELDQDPMGKPLEKAFAHHPQLLRELAPLCRNGQALPHGTVELARRDGSRLAVGLVVEPLRRPDGGLRGSLVLLAEVAALDTRQREAHLLHTLGELGELAAGVAHELRNGLGTLRGQLELLSRAGSADPTLLSEAQGELSQLLRVVTDFLAFARPGTTTLRPIELETLVQRFTRDPTLSPPGVVVRGAPNLRRVRGDEVLLCRALDNLLANAVAAQREAGRTEPVEIVLEPDGSAVALAIRDRGVGLPEVDPERLFDPFRSFRPGGTGLGLALARRVAWLHGGHLVLRNRPQGGVEARLTLPTDPSDLQLEEAPEQERGPNRNGSPWVRFPREDPS